MPVFKEEGSEGMLFQPDGAPRHFYVGTSWLEGFHGSGLPETAQSLHHLSILLDFFV